MTPHYFLIWSFGSKIGSVDGIICPPTDSMNIFYPIARGETPSSERETLIMDDCKTNIQMEEAGKQALRRKIEETYDTILQKRKVTVISTSSVVIYKE